MRKRCMFVLMALAVLISVPAFAADRVIANGSDLWLTRGDGTTFADFSKTPIPAGFFCSKSEPFNGRIVFRGVPVATGEPGVLGRTDTIVQRLDDAVFNKRGVASTRIQVRTLNFENVEPIKTACGLFNVKVNLNGEQPVTRMRILREDENGGRYLAPIAVNLRMVFEPAGGRPSLAPAPELTKSFLFPADSKARWASRPGRGGRQHAGFVLVDTDGDRVPDTHLPGTSNFAAGWGGLEKATTCHLHVDGVHCVTYEDQIW